MDSYPGSITIDHHTSRLKLMIYDFFIWSWDISRMDLASFEQDSAIIFTWFWADFDMIFRWFSNDFDDVLEWSQKHFCKSSDPVLEPLQNQLYRARVNRNLGFQARIRSWYKPEDPRATSISMAPRKVPVLSRWIPSLLGLTWPSLLTIRWSASLNFKYTAVPGTSEG